MASRATDHGGKRGGYPAFPPWVQLLDKVVDMPAVVNDRCPMVQIQKTVEIYGPDHRDITVAVHLKGGRCPAGAVHRVPHFMAVAGW